jgi:hypothetical protein
MRGSRPWRNFSGGSFFWCSQPSPPPCLCVYRFYLYHTQRIRHSQALLSSPPHTRLTPPEIFSGALGPAHLSASAHAGTTCTVCIDTGAHRRSQALLASPPHTWLMPPGIVFWRSQPSSPLCLCVYRRHLYHKPRHRHSQALLSFLPLAAVFGASGPASPSAHPLMLAPGAPTPQFCGAWDTHPNPRSFSRPSPLLEANQIVSTLHVYTPSRDVSSLPAAMPTPKKGLGWTDSPSGPPGLPPPSRLMSAWDLKVPLHPAVVTLDTTEPP